MQTAFVVSQNASGLDIDHDFIGILNERAARYLSMQPGRYRRHYDVKVGDHTPSAWPLVYEEMQGFIDTLHLNWAKWTPVEAAAYVLWGVNHVHPFCEGNGRTARALCYYVLCQKIGQWVPGNNIVLEQLRTLHQAHHIEILQRMHDVRQRPKMETDLTEMTALIDNLLLQQITSYQAEQATAATQLAANSPSTGETQPMP